MTKTQKLLIVSFLLFQSIANAQTDNWSRFDALLGSWEGTGTGFSGGTSIITSSFEQVMNNKYIKIRNESHFQPTEKNSAGEIHQDWGMISYDKTGNKYVFRQFHNEGFVIQYILNDSLSNSKSIVFESEIIENFVDGGKAIFTINLLSEDEIETIFDVSFPEREFVCFGRNRLTKK